MGFPPPVRVIASMINRLWGYEGKVLLSVLSPGFFLFEFPSVKLCEWVLGRTWHIHHSVMVLRKWNSVITLLDLEVKDVPK